MIYIITMKYGYYWFLIIKILWKEFAIFLIKYYERFIKNIIDFKCIEISLSMKVNFLPLISSYP